MTIISHRHKFIFIRPRKVAGASIHAALAPWCGEQDVLAPGYVAHDPKMAAEFGRLEERNTAFGDADDRVVQHALPDVVRRIVGLEVWNDYLKFTVVRNPWDLFVSMHLHRLYARQVQMGPPSLPPADAAHVPRLLRLLEQGHRKQSLECALHERCYAELRAQVPLYYLCSGQAYADFYIRFENLQEDFAALCRRLRLPQLTLPWINGGTRSRDDDYRRYYSDWSKQQVCCQCLQMIKMFGYSFAAPS